MTTEWICWGPQAARADREFQPHGVGRNLGAETVSSGDRIGVSEGMLERLSRGSGQAAEHDGSAEAEQEGM